jgi:hypothetical protein
MDYATEADDMEPTGVSQIPRRESQHQSDSQVAPQFTRQKPLESKPCDHTADMIPRSMNVKPPTVSQDRTQPILNNSGHCFENCTGSRSGIEDTTISANLTTSNSTNAIVSTSSHNRTRSISTNSGHSKENCTGFHLENEVTVSSKITLSKPIRKSLRRNMARNINIYNKHVEKHMKEYKYMEALRALREGRNTNPAHKKMFSYLTYL